MGCKNFTGNRSFVLCVAVLLGLFTVQLSEIPVEGRIYPLILIICSFLFCIYLFAAKQKKEEKENKTTLFSCFVFTVMIVAYIFLLGKLGYILATILFLYATLWFLKVRNVKLLALYPIVLTLLMYFLFNRVLSVLLPEGSLVSLNL